MNRGNKAEYSGNEKWQKFKKEFWGKKLLATTEWGLIDFDPQGKDDMVRYAITMLISFPLKEELSVLTRRNSFYVSKGSL